MSLTDIGMPKGYSCVLCVYDNEKNLELEAKLKKAAEEQGITYLCWKPNPQTARGEFPEHEIILKNAKDKG